MIIHIANGDPMTAIVLMSLSTFKNTALIAAFRSISLSFSVEEAAQNFVKEAKSLGCTYSKLESTNVLVMPDFGGSRPAAKAIYRAVSAYRETLIAVNEVEIVPISEEGSNLLKDVQQYIVEHFGADGVAITTPTH